MAKMNEHDAMQRIRNSKNSISGKKIYLAATSHRVDNMEYRGIYSAGLKVWSAVDFLVNHCNYQIIYEVAGKKQVNEEN